MIHPEPCCSFQTCLIRRNSPRDFYWLRDYLTSPPSHQPPLLQIHTHTHSHTHIFILYHLSIKMDNYEADNVAVRFVLEYETNEFDGNFVPITDSFVVMPSNTRVCGLIPEVIAKLKLGSDQRVINCRSFGCFIVLKNWKPINVEYICDVNETSLMQLVGHFPNFAVIKIRFFRNITPLHQTRNQVLMLLAQAQSLIRNVDLLTESDRPPSVRNPLLLQSTLRDRLMHTGNFMIANNAISHGDASNLSIRDRVSQRPQTTPAYHLHSHTNQVIPSGTKRPSSFPHNLSENCDGTDTVGNNFSGVKRVRERITFDSMTEVPILTSAFERNRHPTREEIDLLLQELNANRKGKRPLEVFNIQYWFKNARAMDKKRRFGVKQETGEGNEEEGDISPPENGIAIKEEIIEIEPSVEQKSADVAKKLHEVTRQNPSSIQLTNADDFVALCQPSDPANGGMNESAAGDLSTDNASTDDQPNVPDQQNDQSTRATGEFHFRPAHDVSSIIDCRSCIMTPSLYVSQSNSNSAPQLDNGAVAGDRQKRRNRVFIDPTTEIPILEKWFAVDTHPSQALIKTICEEMNRGPYRSQYQKLKPRNIQLWFKNHRAKLKRNSKSEISGHVAMPVMVSTTITNLGKSNNAQDGSSNCDNLNMTGDALNPNSCEISNLEQKDNVL
ncbi:hypothetical protein ACOME3_009726 [Neoechinorhynchus agilis]